MANNWFPTWRKRSGNLDGAIIAPDERLPVGATLIMGLQHAVAMFGATVLMPLLMGFDANLAILMSGIGTLLFFLIVGGGCPVILAPVQHLSVWSLPSLAIPAAALIPISL